VSAPNCSPLGIEPAKPEFHWRSISQFGTYTRCGEAYRIEKVLKIKGRPAAWIAGGTAFHEAVDLWETSGRTADAVTAFEIAYWQSIGEMKEIEPDLSRWLRPPRWLPETDINGRFEKGKEQVRQYMEHARAQPWKLAELPDGKPATEVPFELKLSETLGIRGAIDAILEWPDGSRRVRDYKTGSKLPGTASARRLQARRERGSRLGRHARRLLDEQERGDQRPA
jgi:putative RecB family exonuclease